MSKERDLTALYHCVLDWKAEGSLTQRADSFVTCVEYGLRARLGGSYFIVPRRNYEICKVFCYDCTFLKYNVFKSSLRRLKCPVYKFTKEPFCKNTPCRYLNGCRNDIIKNINKYPTEEIKKILKKAISKNIVFLHRVEEFVKNNYKELTNE